MLPFASGLIWLMIPGYRFFPKISEDDPVSFADKFFYDLICPIGTAITSYYELQLICLIIAFEKMLPVLL